MAKQLTDTHYDIAYNLIVEKELDRDEIKDLAKELNESDIYDRNDNSAEFLLSRMHILVHAIAPHGETETRAETMFTICSKMINYANRRGLDTVFNIEFARIELKDRPIRIKYEDVKKLVCDYYFSMPKSSRPNVDRDEVIAKVMEGTAIEEAF